MHSARILGLRFRREGLSPESLGYLDHKLERVRRDEDRKRSLLHRIREALLPGEGEREFLEAYLRGRTLFVGCGRGIEVLGLGAIGLDLDREALRIAADLRRNLEGGPGAFLAADGSRLPFADRAFDTVFSDNVVEHIPGPLLPGHFREAARVLRPGGRYVFNTPNRLFEDPPRPTHISLHTYAEWEELARAAGFRELSTPRRRSGPLGPLAWKKEMEQRFARRNFRMGVSRSGVRMVVIAANL